MMSIERTARIAHEVNRAWCEYNGDFSQTSWENAPAWQKNTARLGVKFHKDNPDADDAASHNSWMTQKLAEGWKHGDVKDPEAQHHPCIVPFEDLPRDQQFKDRLFRTICHATS
jgi:hypothetical protein